MMVQSKTGYELCKNDPEFCGLEKKGSSEKGKTEGEKDAETSSWTQLGPLLGLTEEATEDDIKKECRDEEDPITCSFKMAKAEGEKDAESSSWN